MISIALATEDNLSEEIGRRLIGEMGTNFEVGLTFRKGGYGYLKSSIKKFYSFSKTMPLLLIADLDKAPCANFLISKWIGDRVLPEKFLFRVAVREIEAWLLADHAGMKNLLGPGGTKLPRTPDSLLDPKQVLLNFARKAPRDVRNDLIAERGAIASQGLGYNQRMGDFIQSKWNPSHASSRSDSLRRARIRLKHFAKRLTR
ncbi:MAG: hypothetical protein WDO24_17335 [Pseudomonadota bacterium]